MDIRKIIEKADEFPGSAFRLVNAGGSVNTYSFSRIRNDVDRLVSQLKESGLKPRDLVGIYGDNSYAWIVLDLALIVMDCVSVALPTETIKPDDIYNVNIQYDLTLSVVIENRKFSPKDISQGILHLNEMLEFECGGLRISNGAMVHEDVFSIVFSSGTSGVKKGLLLTRKGVETTIIKSGKGWQICEDDNICIVLPFSNFQQRYLFYCAMYYGSDICMVAPQRMFQKMRSLAPTVLVGPPSFYEMVEHRVNAEKKLHLWRYYLSAVLYFIGGYGVTKKLRWYLCRSWNYFYGENIRLMMVGSAPVKKTTLSMLQVLGLPFFQAYGLTEFGWISFNTTKHNKVGSVGKLVEGVEAKISEDKELWVRNANPQSIGYIFEGTDEQLNVFKPEGYVATGDLCQIDRRGYVYLIGRKKNLIVTRSGVKINPETLEKDIESMPSVVRAMVYANDDAGNLGCFVWVENFSECDVNSLQESIGALSAKQGNQHKYIGKIKFVSAKDLESVEGILTRNLKLNRTAILNHYKADLESVAA